MSFIFSTNGGCDHKTNGTIDYNALNIHIDWQAAMFCIKEKIDMSMNVYEKHSQLCISAITTCFLFIVQFHGGPYQSKVLFVEWHKKFLSSFHLF